MGASSDNADAVKALTHQPSLSDREFNQLRELVFRHTSISLGENKRELVRTRIGKILRRRTMSSYGEYCEFMNSDAVSPEDIEELANAISTNLTSFFRENAHFVFLTEKGIPAMLAAKQNGVRRLRAWSAGCSTGEEAYTMGITFLEKIPGLATWDFRILATDLDTNVLRKAQGGVYEMRQVEAVPPLLRQKYFQQGTGENKGLYKVKESLRRLITFKRLNLMDPYPFRGPFDVIFCRNVMIYFDKPTQTRIIQRYYDLLGPGGYLFVGHSESLTGIDHRFQYVQPTVYMKAR